MLEYKVIKFPTCLFSTMLNSAIVRKTHAHDSHWWQPFPWFCLLRQRPWKNQATAVVTMEWQHERQWSNIRSIARVLWINGLSYDSSMLEDKVINFPSWLFSTMLNSDIGRNTHTHDSQWWQPLLWFCFLRQRPWKIQETAGVIVKWHQEWQLSNIRSIGRVRLINRLRYDCSMLGYKVIKLPPWLFSTMLNWAIFRKTHAHDSHQCQPLPWFCLMRQWPWTIQATEGARVEWQQEWQWRTNRNVGRVRWSQGLSYDSSMLEYKVTKFPPWLFSTMLNSAIVRKTQGHDSHQWQLLPWFCLLRRQPWTIQATAGAIV